jgi:hypothetical protein
MENNIDITYEYKHDLEQNSSTIIVVMFFNRLAEMFLNLLNPGGTLFNLDLLVESAM